MKTNANIRRHQGAPDGLFGISALVTPAQDPDQIDLLAVVDGEPCILDAPEAYPEERP